MLIFSITEFAEKYSGTLSFVATGLGVIITLYRGRWILKCIKIQAKKIFWKMFGFDELSIQIDALVKCVDKIAEQSRLNGNELKILSDKYENILSELKPNGGKSLRDAINRLDARQRAKDNMDIDVGIFETDKTGLYVHVNLQYCHMVGRSIDELRGNGWLNAIDERWRTEIFNEWNNAITGKRIFECQYDIQTTYDKKITVDARAVPVFESNGEIVGYYGTINKITK
jgi:PAS domain S-box-containing protein